MATKRDREVLEGWLRASKTPSSRAVRARIVLGSTAGATAAEVAAGDQIGTVGRSGNVPDGVPDHLHFEIRTENPPGGGLNNRLDPEPELEIVLPVEDEREPPRV